MKEIFKPIKGYEDYYEISNYGNIRSLNRIVIKSNGVLTNYKGKEIKGVVDKNGYCIVTLNKSGERLSKSVHRLVAEHFNKKNDKSLVVNHIDGDKTNNNSKNLEWVTLKENIRHAFRIGLISQKGEKNNNSKLNYQMVIDIRSRRENGESLREISKDYPVSKNYLSNVINKITWK